ncbi:hypothetical protein BU17DRAFT_68616 [Hysterangium stoloniferum]|nr:hypothetical protein BU17DRAFT_68616 [Hysterangium stoloniferum]
MASAKLSTYIYYVDIPERYEMGNQLDVGYDSTPQKRASRPNKARSMEDGRWQMADGRVLCYTKIFKGRLFKKQLHSNYLPLAISSHTSLTTGIAVLFSYDTILTLPAEIQFVWKSRIRLPSVLYIIARYFSLIERICFVVFDWADGPLEVGGEAGPKMLPRLIAVDRNVMLWMDVRDITGKGLRYKQISEIPFNTDIVNISRRILLPCDTAEAALTITFDGLILFITLFYTIGTIRLQRDIKGLRKRSITYPIVQQEHNKTPFSGTGINMEGWQHIRPPRLPLLSRCARIKLVVSRDQFDEQFRGHYLPSVGDFIPSASHEGELPVHSAEGCEEACGGERVEGHGAQ